MNHSFIRKIAYITGMALLLVPLSLMSQPESVGEAGAKSTNQGGTLARLRQKHELSQSRLGEIDPAGETIKLATLGMKGFAVTLLWMKSNDYKMKEDWHSLSASLEQMSKLQPNFISVWRYQGWNLSYNVSVEWDDYKQRYFWVLKGCDFLKEGMQYNEREPRLPWDIGWVIGHKMGTADEKKQYRVLFRQDDDYNAGRGIFERDNWLVGKESFLAAQSIVDDRGVPVQGTSPVIFHSGPAKWQTNYAAHLEIDGGVDGKAVFGERARTAWDKAVREWEEFASQRDIVTSIGAKIRVGELENYEKRVVELVAELDALQPGLRQQIEAEKIARLSENEQEVLKIPADSRTPEQSTTFYQTENKIRVGHQEVADRVDSKLRDKANKLALEIADIEKVIRVTKTSRETIQYIYWYTRCLAEREPECLAAREAMYKANRAYLDETDLESARTLYEQSFKEWRKVFDKFPLLMTDRVVTDDLVGPSYLPGAVRYYEKLLGEIGEKFPEKFILHDFMVSAQPDPPIAGYSAPQ